MSTKKRSQARPKARKAPGKLKEPLPKSPQTSTKNISGFRLDRQFIKELHTRILNHRKEFLGSSDKNETSEIFPTQDQLEQIILAMFWASLKPEEGRLSRFRATFAEPLPINHLSLIFENPKPLTIEEFRKIAPAVVPPDGQVVVWPHGERGELHIWGLQTTDLMHLFVEAFEPGRVTVKHMTLIAEVTGQRAGFVSPDWESRGLQMMGARKTNRKRVPIDEALSFLRGCLTQEILSRMRLLGHGGAIIFVPDGSEWEQSVEQPLVYAYDQPFREMSQTVEYFVKEVGKVADKSAGSDNREGQIMQAGLSLISDHRFKEFVADAARSIAYLSAVDGATILNNNFEVLSFGARLRVPEKGTRTEKVLSISPLESDSDPGQVPMEHEFRGTRHLSAAQFVFNNPGSVAFVVSQDGGITGLVMSESEGGEPGPLLAYRGLELLL